MEKTLLVKLVESEEGKMHSVEEVRLFLQQLFGGTCNVEISGPRDIDPQGTEGFYVITLEVGSKIDGNPPTSGSGFGGKNP